MRQGMQELIVGTYQVDDTTGEITGSPGAYVLHVYGDAMHIKSVAETIDGAAIITPKKKGFAYRVEPSPIKKEV